MADMSVLLCDVVVVLAWDSALVLAVESPAHSHEQKQGRGEDLVKTSYMVRTAQNTLEAYRYIDCGSNSTSRQQPLRPRLL
ncbi:hypothetical protein JZ751_007353 [Albula glossodonta]|uniref:Transmembrane protein 106 C-terminal domain-containing protein n=1 Tax=Albula glossodonta TaxID=121402 RepID=A0A8T2MPW9_9TELE|nr:hypothetical protein JZ751_007353 [Albula glossodonta]